MVVLLRRAITRTPERVSRMVERVLVRPRCYWTSGFFPFAPIPSSSVRVSPDFPFLSLNVILRR
jgi:hypothetical protein